MGAAVRVWNGTSWDDVQQTHTHTGYGALTATQSWSGVNTFSRYLTVQDDVPPSALANAVRVYSTGGRGKVMDALGNVWSLDSSVFTRLAANTGSTQTVVGSFTIMLASPTLSAGTYAFDCNGLLQSSVTTAAPRLAFRMTGGGAVSALTVAGITATGPTAASNWNVVAVDSVGSQAAAAVTAATTYYPFQTTGTFVVSTAGVFNVTLGTSSAATATMALGSFLRIARIA